MFGRNNLLGGLTPIIQLGLQMRYFKEQQSQQALKTAGFFRQRLNFARADELPGLAEDARIAQMQYPDLWPADLAPERIQAASAGATRVASPSAAGAAPQGPSREGPPIDSPEWQKAGYVSREAYAAREPGVQAGEQAANFGRLGGPLAMESLQSLVANDDRGPGWHMMQMDDAPPIMSSVIEDWGPQIWQVAEEEGVDPRLLAAVIAQESSGQPDAVSPAGAIGLMQLMPGTAQELGVDPNDPLANMRGGARYLKKQLEATGGNVPMALARFNVGPNNATIQLGRIPQNGETPEYVNKVTGYMDSIKLTDIHSLQMETMNRAAQLDEDGKDPYFRIIEDYAERIGTLGTDGALATIKPALMVIDQRLAAATAAAKSDADRRDAVLKQQNAFARWVVGTYAGAREAGLLTGDDLSSPDALASIMGAGLEEEDRANVRRVMTEGFRLIESGSHTAGEAFEWVVANLGGPGGAFPVNEGGASFASRLYGEDMKEKIKAIYEALGEDANGLFYPKTRELHIITKSGRQAIIPVDGVMKTGTDSRPMEKSPAEKKTTPPIYDPFARTAQPGPVGLAPYSGPAEPPRQRFHDNYDLRLLGTAARGAGQGLQAGGQGLIQLLEMLGRIKALQGAAGQQRTTR